MKILTKASAYFALGLVNLATVALYRFNLKTGFNRVRRIRAQVQRPPFFNAVSYTNSPATLSGSWKDNALVFGFWTYPLNDKVPKWHSNPLTGVEIKSADLDWWIIPDFDPAIGDIKVIWEASRFDWVLAFAQRAKAGDRDSMVRLNTWLENWCTQNPPYKGPNWKCGQEASIRVMHLAMAAIILEQIDAPCAGILGLIELHLQRIEPTIGYAMAQDNNHGTSEAAALFIGGSWLLRAGNASPQRWERLGRKWLENRARRLIESDGSFSQYSVNYHRVMLDTFCMVESWRRCLELPRFSATFYERATAATLWLYALVDAQTGDAPNIGANDGARLLQLTDSDYRDFRPTVQLSMALFDRKLAYKEPGVWDEPLKWLGFAQPVELASTPKSYLFDDGGYGVLRAGGAMALLRYPRFRFRPSHADILHLDLWHGGVNLLRDAGTYSYNTEQKWINYFPGTVSHNTVQFDDRDQMPRISRFLYGNWLKTSYIEPLTENKEGVFFAAGYRDRNGTSHNRHVHLTANALRVTDHIDGFQHKATLRWRLPTGDWVLNGSMLSNGKQSIAVSASMPVVRIEVVEGWESRYYLNILPVVVLEVEVQQSGTLTTEYFWKV